MRTQPTLRSCDLQTVKMVPFVASRHFLNETSEPDLPWEKKKKKEDRLTPTPGPPRAGLSPLKEPWAPFPAQLSGLRPRALRHLSRRLLCLPSLPPKPEADTCSTEVAPAAKWPREQSQGTKERRSHRSCFHVKNIYFAKRSHKSREEIEGYQLAYVKIQIRAAGGQSR